MARRSPPAPVVQSIGPLTLNVTLARALGWEEQEIVEVAAHVNFIARDHAERCMERYPSRFRRVEGVVVFLGELPKE